MILLLVLSSQVFGQMPGKKMEGPAVLFDTLTISIGDILLLGKGSDSVSHHFVHIYTPKNYFTDLRTSGEYEVTPQTGLSKGFEGRYYALVDVRRVSSKKKGDFLLGVIDPGARLDDDRISFGMNKVAVNLELAILTGEIIKINDMDFTNKEKKHTDESPHFRLIREGVLPLEFLMDGLSADDLFQKTNRWYDMHYKNIPEKSITVADNNLVEIRSIEKNMYIAKVLGMELYGDMEYLMKVHCINNFIQIRFVLGNEEGQFSEDVNQSDYFDENGNVNNRYKRSKDGIEKMMNDHAMSLITYLIE